MIAARKPAQRPLKYHRPNETALRRLHANGYSDREIAEILWDLSEAAIAALQRCGRWNQHTLRRAMVPESGYQWTRRQIHYYRTQLELPANRQRAQAVSENMLAMREYKRAEYQRQSGWLHLLPAHDLRPRECDILSLLRENGPMTRREIAAAFRFKLGLKAGGQAPLRSRRRRYLPTLERAGLIERGAARAFQLAAHAVGQQRRRLQTGPERLAAKIGRHSSVRNSDD